MQHISDIPTSNLLHIHLQSRFNGLNSKQPSVVDSLKELCCTHCLYVHYFFLFFTVNIWSEEIFNVPLVRFS